MVTLTTEVDFNLDDVDKYDLIDELESRGYYVKSYEEIDYDELDTDEMIEEIQRRGYTVYGKKSDIIWNFYQAYILDDEEKFRAEVARVLRENGYRP